MMQHLTMLHDEFERLITDVNVIAGKKWPNEPIGDNSRRILRTLRRNGPMTCADLARDRHTTRQCTCKLVEQLLAEQYIITSQNPAHKTAKLVVLTDMSCDYIEKYDCKFTDFFTELLDLRMQQIDICTAAHLGEEIRRKFDDWLLTH